MKIIEEEWKIFADRILHNVKDESLKSMAKICFFAGAYSLMRSIMNNLTEDEDPDNPDDAALLAGVDKELCEFFSKETLEKVKGGIYAPDELRTHH